MGRQMKKKRRIGSLVILGCFLYSGSLLLADKAPKIKFREVSRDFGRVKQGEILSYVFVFNNEGDATLTIKKVRTSCGCTAALVSTKEIAPGERGEIKVTLETRGYEGKVSKYIYVESNDPVQTQKRLTVSAEIEVPPRPRIELDRYSADLGLILETEEIQISSKIKNRGQVGLKVNCSHRDAAFFYKGKKISFPLMIPSGKEVGIEIKMPPRKRKGLIREYVLMKSNDPRRPNLSLYLSGYVVTKKQLKELFTKYKDILD